MTPPSIRSGNSVLTFTIHPVYLRRIKRTSPDALIIRVLRDGREVSLSLAKQSWIKPFPWDHETDNYCWVRNPAKDT